MRTKFMTCVFVAFVAATAVACGSDGGPTVTADGLGAAGSVELPEPLATAADTISATDDHFVVSGTTGESLLVSAFDLESSAWDDTVTIDEGFSWQVVGGTTSTSVVAGVCEGEKQGDVCSSPQGNVRLYQIEDGALVETVDGPDLTGLDGGFSDLRAAAQGDAVIVAVRTDTAASHLYRWTGGASDDLGANAAVRRMCSTETTTYVQTFIPPGVTAPPGATVTESGEVIVTAPAPGAATPRSVPPGQAPDAGLETTKLLMREITAQGRISEPYEAGVTGDFSINGELLCTNTQASQLVDGRWRPLTDRTLGTATGEPGLQTTQALSASPVSGPGGNVPEIVVTDAQKSGQPSLVGVDSTTNQNLVSDQSTVVSAARTGRFAAVLSSDASDVTLDEPVSPDNAPIRKLTVFAD